MQNCIKVNKSKSGVYSRLPICGKQIKPDVYITSSKLTPKLKCFSVYFLSWYPSWRPRLQLLGMNFPLISASPAAQEEASGISRGCRKRLELHLKRLRRPRVQEGVRVLRVLPSRRPFRVEGVRLRRPRVALRRVEGHGPRVRGEGWSPAGRRPVHLARDRSCGTHYLAQPLVRLREARRGARAQRRGTTRLRWRVVHLESTHLKSAAFALSPSETEGSDRTVPCYLFLLRHVHTIVLLFDGIVLMQMQR